MPPHSPSPFSSSSSSHIVSIARARASTQERPRERERELIACWWMAQDDEDVGLALGLSLGSGGHRRQRESRDEKAPSSAAASLLTLRLPAESGVKAVVKRELQARAEEEEEEYERALYSSSAAAAVVDDDEAGCNSRKKLRLTKEQSALLEDRFKEHSTLNPRQKVALAKQLNLRPRQVEVWFQNRRARTKLKQTEVDCELLKRCCETLTEENRRLHRELQQLRALSHPGFFMATTLPVPAATLSICPSCERLATAAAADRTNKPTAPHFFSPFAKSAAC